MKIKFVALLFLFLFPCLQAQEKERLLTAVERAIENAPQYKKQKHAQLDSLKKRALKKELSGSEGEIHRAYIDLYEGYKAFRYDSAYYYLERAKSLASKLNDSSLIAGTKIKEGFILISAGLFTEALDTLNSIDTRLLGPGDSFDFHYNRARAYFDLADYNDDGRVRINYVRKGIHNLQEALTKVDPGSSGHLKSLGLKYLKQQDWPQAEAIYLQWLQGELTPQQYGVATSSLSYVYQQMGRDREAFNYLAMAAISDMENAIQENTALRNLAIMLYENGELNKANHYVRVAFEDAEIYNARHRRNQISAVLPITERAQLYKVEQKNKSLQRTVILLAVLAGIILVFLGIIIKQNREKKVVRKAISENNERLKQMNLSLVEADAIKQDYITYFLKATSQLINKMAALQKNTILKIRTKKPEEVLDVLQRYSAKKERDALFHQFDEVFLQLFPTFIKRMEDLFPESEKGLIKNGDLLNTELRIFALFRLGIQDNRQIAEFLDVSISTVYSYKTRMKGRSSHRDEFEDKIMDIKRFSG